ncbi:MAG: histidine--tRNA ligase [Myxococcales bacterium]|nr:histidine--tRNA ligase [Myxococcales bacterium]USN50082.1 MAG: histidine--tRNA ligase [Myxococcales bacterium]
MVVAKAVRGMNDLFPKELHLWQKIEDAIKSIFPLYAYQEIRTPILEDLALFKRGIGETTDIVEKEMFIVPDGDHTYCLRPENTAAVVRALIERGGISADSQEKLYYIGPMFRKERPQKGRLRQFHQYGIELFGVSEPAADVEIMAMVQHLFDRLGPKNIELKINSLGTNEERNSYKIHLKDYLTDKKLLLCNDCQRRLDLNPLRILDCKNDGCKEIIKDAPKSIDSLGVESRTHFDQVLFGLSDININFSIEHNLVRGLDYYNRTVFEFVAKEGLGAQNTIAAGGRYDGLFLTLGNKIDLPAIGCAGGIERLALLLEDGESNNEGPKISLIGADQDGQKIVKSLAYALRKMNIAADFPLQPKSMKAMMRRADKLKASFVAVVGQEEIKNGRVKIKDMKTSASTELNLEAYQIAHHLGNSISEE